MCSRVTCRTCGKPTWSGCGNHVESALAGIPRNERCQGHAASAPAPQQPQRRSGSFLSRLLGGE